VKVYRGIEQFERVENAVVTTGTFDGVHVGHKQIIGRLKEIAAKQRGETVLLTFHPHPRLVLYPDDNELRLINTMDEKIALLEKAGIDHLIIHPFTKEFSRLSSIEFVRDILVNKIGTSRLVIGYNHHFGRNREGSFEHLMEYGPVYGFEVEEISAHDVDQVNVSSTKIREALQQGDVATASRYLDYSYSLTGEVVHGDKVGRSIGYPTANLSVPESFKLIPADGVYAVRVNVAGEFYKGMLNIGHRPTLSEAQKKTIEVHLIQFEGDLYGQQLTVELKARLRGEKKFENMESLQKQLDIDRNKSLQLLV